MEKFYEVEKFSNQVALITEDRKKITYNELAKNADVLGKFLDKNKLAFCVCKNCEESVVGYLAFLRSKIASVLLSENINKTLFSKLIFKYKPTYIWSPFSIEDGEIIFQSGDYFLIKTSFCKDYDINPDLALLLTTSGSTGSPKLVKQSYKNIESNSVSIAKYLEISKTDKSITTLPMNYTYGLSIINSYLSVGATIIMTTKTLMDKEFWSLLKEEGATSFGGVPYTYEILKRLRFSRMDLPSIKTLTQAGGHLTKELAIEFANACKEKGIRFFIMYGQTEASPRMSYVPYEKAIEKASSIGIAIPGGLLYIEDENGNKIEKCDSVGELVYKGDNVCLGYADDCFDLVKTDENFGVLRTGDMAKMDEDGYFYIVGRKKRFLKLFGNRINLDEVEMMLKSDSFNCACVGVDDNMIVYTTDNTNLITEFIKTKTDINHSGFTVIKIDDIPRNESGKILYSSLQNGVKLYGN